MSEIPRKSDIYFDFLPNLPQNEPSRNLIKQFLRSDFEEKLSSAVERTFELPRFAVMNVGIYADLLVEARALFVAGYFYSCVAMCGIVGERIIKDELRASVQIKKGDLVQSPDSTAFDQFERTDMKSIAHFLYEADLLSNNAIKAVDSLVELRNKYAHARGKKPEDDAINAIRFLHTLIEDTVSVFKDFEIMNGVLVRKLGGNLY